MKNRAIAVALTGVLALGIVGCGGGQQAETTEATSTTTTEEASATAQQESSVSWNEVASADAAAKGAGFSDFVVLKSLSVAGQELADPTFAYADGVAQAVYEKGPVVLVVRKADGKRNAPLTDRETAALNSKWFKNYDGVDVTLYGPKQGDAIVLTWANGQQEYGITVESSGGEDLYLTTGEVASIVSGLSGANPTKESDTDSASSDTSNSEADAIALQEGYITSEEAKQCAINSYGDSTGVKNVKVELKNDPDYPHYNVTFVAGGMQYLFEVDAYTGGIWSIEESEATSSSTSDDADSSSSSTGASTTSSTGDTGSTTGTVSSSSSTEATSTGNASSTTANADATTTGTYTESTAASEASE